MLEIRDNKIFFNGEEYTILELDVDENVVHLINLVGHGICANITEDMKVTLLNLMN